MRPRIPRVPRRDALLALGLLLVAESQVFLGWQDGGVGVVPSGHHVARALLGAALVVPLAWRRVAPHASLVAVVLAIAGQLLVVPYLPFLAGLLPLALATYAAAAYAEARRPTGLALALAAVVGIVVRVPEEHHVGEVLFSVFVVTGTWVAGEVVRARSARASVAITAAETTVAEERVRIARELHDVIAHGVSVMGVQAGAARTLLDRDPEAARAALLTVEGTARDAVAELQRLLTVLRGRDASEGLAPQPGLAELPALVERMREAGLPVELQGGGLGELPVGLDLAAYRIVQEALTNALKHAGSTTTVRVCREDAILRLEVRNPVREGPLHPGAGGHGLVGMRERVLLYGGQLDARVVDSEFVVGAWLPVGTDVGTSA